MRKKRLTKKEIAEITDSYSLRANDFEEIASEPGYKYVYKSRRPNKGRYIITIMPQDSVIYVIQADQTGRRTFTDTWQRDKNGCLVWLFRNPANVPLSDFAAIKDMQQEIDELKEAGRKQQEQLKEYQITWAINETIAELKAENEKLRAELEEYRRSQSFTATKPRKAGRPKGSIKQKGITDDIGALMRDGLSDKEIIDRLKMSRATFYRRKKQMAGTI